jgi:spore coat protein U-like protein
MRPLARVVSFLLALGLGATVQAGSVQSGSTVALSVFNSCLLSTANDVAFGNYAPTVASPTTATTSFSAVCTLGTTVTVTLTTANGYLLKGPAAQALTYGLYRDANHTEAFPPAAGASPYRVTALGILFPVTGTLYGQVPAGQDVGPGAYHDTATLTFTY